MLLPVFFRIVAAGSYFPVIVAYCGLCRSLVYFTMESAAGSKVKLSGRYCCVTGCSSSDYNLDNWGKLQCLVHNRLNRSDECNCNPPYHLHSFPTKATCYEEKMVAAD